MNEQQLVNFSQRVADRYKKENLRVTFHLSGGNEKQLIDIFKQIKEGDYVISTHRNHYHALLHGIPEKELEDKIASGRSMYIYDRKRNFFCTAIIGGGVAIAAGIAFALKRKKSSQKVWCFIGDGTEDNGHLYEAARYVDGWDLPCTYIIEDNRRSVDASVPDRWGKDTRPTHPKCVQRYYYNPIFPHIRTEAKLDFTNSYLPKNEILFPKLDQEKLKPFTTTEKDISFKNAVKKSMENLASDNGIFIGYSVKYGDAMGVLGNVSAEQKIETPVAENLMAGLAIGMSFEGFRPVVYFERHDFMLVAADAIVNHMGHIERASHGEFKTPVIMRTIVVDGGPFYAGPTHSQDFTEAFKSMVSFPIYTPKTGLEVLECYDKALQSQRPSIIVEKKSLY